MVTLQISFLILAEMKVLTTNVTKLENHQRRKNIFFTEKYILSFKALFKMKYFSLSYATTGIECVLHSETFYFKL